MKVKIKRPNEDDSKAKTVEKTVPIARAVREGTFVYVVDEKKTAPAPKPAKNKGD